MLKLIRRTFLLAFLATALAGCCGGGPTLGRVEGKVTLDGQPLANAKVEFQPSNNAPSYGTTDAQGHYELVFAPEQFGAIPGEHVVRITTYRASNEPGSTEVIEESVPAIYNSESTLRKTVTKGEQVIDLALTTPTTP